jgi:uncharacterized protein
MKSRIVIDTSVLISALIGSTGASRELIRLCLQGEYQPLMGNNLFLEYESVVLREKIITQCIPSQGRVFAFLKD